MPLLVEPLARPVLRGLRTEVQVLKLRHPRRPVPATLHVGIPGDPELSRFVALDDDLDQGLRASLVGALLDVVPSGGSDAPPWVWVARGGVTSWHDLDADWLAPTVQAYGEAGLAATFVVVTRQGWLDPRSGTGRWWKRLRTR